MSKQIFGETLKQQRKVAGFSQEKLALDCGLSSYYIVLLEQGKRQPSMTTLFKLASSLKINPDTLIQPAWEAYEINAETL